MKPILNPFAPEHRALLGEVLRFVVVGITAVALQYGVYALMLLVVNAFIANTIGYGVSFLFNFLASTRYTFKVKGSARKGVGFALCHVVNYGLQQLTIEEEGREPSALQLQQLIETARQRKPRVLFMQKEFANRNIRVVAESTHTKIVEINPLSYQWPQEMRHIAQALK